MIKYSVIIPVYNVENYISKCLDSLVNQTYKDLEIIIVNDGSTDKSLDIVLNYQKKYSNIKLFNIDNHGQSYARNYGLKYARGIYISFIDSDDYVDTNLFLEIDNFLKNKNYDIVMFSYKAISKDGKVLFHKDFDVDDNYNVSSIEYLFSDPSVWNKIYKKEFLDKISFHLPEGMIYEDYCYIPTLIKYSPKIGYIKKSLYYYVYSDASTTRNIEYKEKYEDLIKASNILYNEFKDSTYLNEIAFIIYYHFLYLGSLNFYKFKKYDKIDKISDFMMEKFPNWRKNKYVLKRDKKEKLLAYLFYKKRYKLIKFMQTIKGLIVYEK